VSFAVTVVLQISLLILSYFFDWEGPLYFYFYGMVIFAFFPEAFKWLRTLDGVTAMMIVYPVLIIFFSTVFSFFISLIAVVVDYFAND